MNFKLRMHQNPFNGRQIPSIIKECGPGNREIGEKERGRGDKPTKVKK